MLPFGIECDEAAESVAAEAARLPRDLVDKATVVLSCGSGVTLGGLLRGLPVTPKKIIGVSSGRSVDQIKRCIVRHQHVMPSYVELIAPSIPYYEAPKLQCPFPCHPHYDLKAWEHLIQHLYRYDDTLIFWNVGG